MQAAEIRKYRLINALMELKSDSILDKIEHLLKKDRKAQAKVSIYDFVGFLSNDEAKIMKDTIAVSCERIDKDVWK